MRTCCTLLQAEMEHRISLTQVRFLTEVSNQLETFKNISFLLALVINLLLLLSASTSPTSDLLPDFAISTLLSAVTMGGVGAFNGNFTWKALKCVEELCTVAGPIRYACAAVPLMFVLSCVGECVSQSL
jgi:hypothetical protein